MTRFSDQPRPQGFSLKNGKREKPWGRDCFRTTAIGDEGPINPIEEAKRLGANLATPEKANIARERKM